MALLRSDFVFELACTGVGEWRAFYRCEAYDPPDCIFPRRYRQAIGATPAEAICNAAAAAITLKLK